jgi:hypothetical protein
MSEIEHDKGYAHRVTGMKCQSFRFKCNGTENPTEVLGEGVTVEFDAVNVWAIAFDGAYRNLFTAHASVSGGDGAPQARVSNIVDGPGTPASFRVTYLSQDPVSGLYDVTDVPEDGDDVWIHVNVDFYDVGGRLDGAYGHPLRAPDSRASAREDGALRLPGHRGG